MSNDKPKTKAIVTEAFPGARDGEFTVTQFAVGDAIEGDIADVAIANKWAKNASEKEFAAAVAAAEAAKPAAGDAFDTPPDPRLLAKMAELRNDKELAELALAEKTAALEKAEAEIAALKADLEAATAPKA